MNEMNMFLFIVNVLVVALCGFLFPIIPALTRKSFLFGVRVPPEEQNCAPAKEMKRNYIATCLLGTALVLAICVAQFGLLPRITLIFTMYFPFLFIPIQLIAFIPNWKKTLQLKEERGWKIPGTVFAETSSSHSRGTLSEMPWGWYIAGLLLVIGSVIIALIKYPSLPDVIVTHYGPNMQPNAWEDKSLGWILLLPMINLVITASLIPVGIMFVRAKLQIDQSNPALSFAQHKLYRRKIGNAIGALVLSMAVMFAFIGFTMLWPEILSFMWIIHPIWIAPTVWLVYQSIRCGQGGCKLKPKIIVNRQTVGYGIADTASGRGDDKYWALGMFYHNPDDPAVIVEDRFGSNLGFNYARLSVKIGITLFLSVFVGGYIWLTVWLRTLI